MPPNTVVDSPLGTRTAWIRDFTVVGAASTLAPLVIVRGGMPDFVAGAAVVGPIIGALLGLVLRPVLLGPMSKVPCGLLILVGALLGGMWGALDGGLAAIVGPYLHDPDPHSYVQATPFLGTLVGGVAGAFQVGWFFVPYTVLRARGKAAWPVVVAACAVSPTLGFIALYGLGFVKHAMH